MMTFFRTHSRFVLAVLLLLAVGFLFYGNSGNFLGSGGGVTPTDFGKIDGDTISIAELTAAVRNERAVMLLHPREEQLSQAQIARNAWSRLLLLHEADLMHIATPDDQKAADAQLGAYIQAIPPFVRDGKYDPQILAMYLKYTHMDFPAFAALMQDQIRLEKTYNALFSSVRSVSSDIDKNYQKYYGPETISYITFPAASYQAAAKPTADEIAAEYKANPMNPAYRTDEKRQVEYVLFPLTADQMKLADKDKAPLIQALGEKAIDFAAKVEPDPSAPNATNAAPPDFAAEAKTRSLTPVTTDLFTANTPPSGLPPSPAFNNAAFALTKEDPISKAVQLDNGIVVIHLLKIQPSELRPLADVTPAIEKELQQKQGAQAQEAAAAIASALIQAEVAKGADFKAIAAAQHLTVDTVTGIVPRKVSMDDEKQATLAYYSAELPSGAVSKPIPLQSDNSFLVLHVDSRAPADPTGMADFETKYRAEQDAQLRSGAFVDWASWMNKQPGTHPPPSLEAYGAVGAD